MMFCILNFEFIWNLEFRILDFICLSIPQTPGTQKAGILYSRAICRAYSGLDFDNKL
jgi:hypothetical protein